VIALLALIFLAVSVAAHLVPLSAEFGGRLRLPPVDALATALYVLFASAPALTGESPSAGCGHVGRRPELGARTARCVAGVRGSPRRPCPCPR
jgi:hypothetical protein